MKLIGSRTGEYEYWVKLPCGFRKWFGQKPNSDTDILISVNEEKPKGNFDIFYGEPSWGPYVENNRLVVPDNFDYLMFPLCNKLFLNDIAGKLIKNYQKTADVENIEGKKVGEIFLDYAKIPMAICYQIAARAELVKQRALKTSLPRPWA